MAKVVKDYQRLLKGGNNASNGEGSQGLSEIAQAIAKNLENR